MKLRKKPSNKKNSAALPKAFVKTLLHPALKLKITLVEAYCSRMGLF